MMKKHKTLTRFIGNCTFTVLIVLIVLAMSEHVFAIKATLSGSSNINGFITTKDTLKGEIIIESTTKIDPKQVRLEYSNTYKSFKTCTEDSPGIQKCVYEETPAYAGSYKVSYYSSNDIGGTPIFSEEIEVKEDRYGPEIAEFNILPSITNQNNIDIEYLIKDYADVIGVTSSCTGIKSISLVVDNTDTRTYQGNGLCEQSGTQPYSVQTTGNNKKFELCLSAQDHSGTVGKKVCKELIFDQKNPEIISLTFKDKKGKVLTHVGNNQPFDADAFVAIQDTALDKTSILGDFSKLNPSENERKYNTEFPGNVYSWSIKITDPKNCEAEIKASDLLGNKEEQTIQCSLPLDDIAPEIKELKGEKQNKKGLTLVGKETKITAVFKEEGSGVKKAFLDASQLGMSDKVESDKCENNTCTFTVTPQGVKDGEYILAVNPDTSDEVNNKVSNNVPLRVVYDSSPPTITSIKPEIITGQEKGAVLVKGHTLKLVVEGTDLNSINANFSQIGGSLAKGVCKEVSNKTVCEANSIVTNSGYYKFKVPVIVYDEAGNSASKEYEGEVFELTSGEQTYWNVKTSCSPQRLDRQLTARKKLSFFCHAHLSPANLAQNPSVLTSRLDFPSDCALDDAGMITNVEVSNAESADPYLEISLDQVSGANMLNTSCNLRVYTKLGNSVVKNPQTIKVPLRMEFYNQPYGDVHSKFKQEYEEAIDKAENFGKEIGLDKLSDAMNSIEQVCEVKTTINEVMTTLFGLASLVGGVEDYLSWLPAASQAAYTVRQTLCGANEGLNDAYLGGGPSKLDAIYEPINKLCMIANCQLGVGLEESGWMKSVKQWAGGQAPWCRKWNEDFLKENKFAKDILTEANIEQQRQGRSTIQVWDVQDSLVTSAGCLCLPGIIKNLEKKRQVQCRYALCLKNDIPNLGINKEECKEEKNFAECAFVLGEAWHIIPFTNLLDYVTVKVGEIIDDPINLLSTFAAVKCKDSCTQKPSTLYAACAGLRTFSVLGEAYQTYNKIADAKKDENKNSNIDHCKTLEDEKNKI